MADEWVAMFQSYDAFAAAHPRGLHLTTFENLTDLNSRTQTLVEILQVLGVPAHSRKGVYSSLEAAAGPSVEGTCSAAMTDVLATQACTAAPADDAAPSVLSPVRRTEAAAASVPSSGQQKPYQPQYNSARLQCAFDLAQHPSIYRPKDPQGIDMSFVYHNEASLVCEIWEVVHSRAAAFGYKPFGGISC